MPIFALANAGVVVSLGGVQEPVAIAAAAGLVVGKPAGIVVATFVVTRLRFVQLPDRTTWPALIGAACLGGIGFTMALFIGSLSLDPAILAVAQPGSSRARRSAS